MHRGYRNIGFVLFLSITLLPSANGGIFGRLRDHWGSNGLSTRQFYTLRDPNPQLSQSRTRNACYCGNFQGNCIAFRYGELSAREWKRNTFCTREICDSFSKTLAGECGGDWGYYDPSAPIVAVAQNQTSNSSPTGPVATSGQPFPEKQVVYRNVNFPSPNGFFYRHGGTCAQPNVNTIERNKPIDVQPGYVHVEIKRNSNWQAFVNGALRLGAKSVELNLNSPCRKEFSLAPGLSTPGIEVLITVNPGDELRFAGQCGIQLSAFPTDGDVPTCYLASPSLVNDQRRSWSEHPEGLQKFP